MENINIGIRSLKGEIYKITVNTSDTIQNIKQRISKLNEVEMQYIKLVSKGRILHNYQTIANYKIKDNDVLNWMVPFPKNLNKQIINQQPITIQTKNNFIKQQQVQIQQNKITQQLSNKFLYHAQPQKGIKIEDERKQYKCKQQTQIKHTKMQSPQMANENINKFVNMGFSVQKCKQAIEKVANDFDKALEYLINNPQPNLQVKQQNKQQQAINRLVKMGFNKQQVIWALTQSNKNQYIAANILADKCLKQEN